LQAVAVGIRRQSSEFGGADWLEFIEGISKMLLAVLPQRLDKLLLCVTRSITHLSANPMARHFCDARMRCSDATFECNSRLILVSRLINRSSMVYFEPDHIKKSNNQLHHQQITDLSILL